MGEGKGPATEDRMQLERYLKWRRAELRRRAARRRRWFGYVAAVFLGVVGLALVPWGTELAREARARVVFERRQAPPESVATASHDSEPRAPQSAPLAGTVVEREPAEGGPWVAEPTLPPRPPASLPSPVAEDPAQTPDVAAGLRVPDPSRGPDAAVSPLPSPTSTTATPAVIQTEAARVPWFANSNPDHQVELHPLTKIGALDFLGDVKRIRDGNEAFTGYGITQLKTILKMKLTIERVVAGDGSYIRLVGTKGSNHWNLRGRVVGTLEPLSDGTRLRLDIMQGNQVVPGAIGLSAVTIAGTAADTAVQSLTSGDVIRVQTLIRLQLPTILAHTTDTAREIALPIEFVILDVE